MITNNSKALVEAEKLEKAEVMSLIQEIYDYGIKSLKVLDIIKEKPNCKAVVGALNNADTDGMLSILAKTNPAGIIAGLSILATIAGVDEAVLVLKNNDNEEELMANAKTVGIKLKVQVNELVNVREYKDEPIFHLETLAAISDKITGIEPQIILAVNNDVPKEVKFGTKLIDLVDKTKVKAVMINHHFYGIDVLNNNITKEISYGSGVIHVIFQDECIVQKTMEYIKALRKKSCGKCTFCREGLYQLNTIFDDIVESRSKKEDIAMIEELVSAMKLSGNCSLGIMAGSPAESALSVFKTEVEAHIKKKNCPTSKCLAFTNMYVDPAKCKGCGRCLGICPKACIEGKKGYISIIDEFDCIKCGKCISECPNEAIVKVSGKLPKLPTKLIKVKGIKKVEEIVNKKEKNKKRHRVKINIPLAKNSDEASKVISEVKKPKEGTIMKKMDTDIIIVAGGPAGLAAAITAGENNLKSIIFEKSTTTGGAANMGMGPLGIDSKVQRNNFNNISVKEALDMHMKYTHYRVDGDLVQTYFNKSADTIEWLEDMGVEFAGAYRYFKESEATWHIVKPENGVIGPRAASAMAKIMTERAKELGAEILLGTPVVSLIKEDGRICGVTAEDSDGTLIEARAKAVIVATGGFGNNKEMVKKEFGLTMGQDFFPFMVPGITGDGLRMMWEAGAVKYGANIEAIYQLPDNLSWFLLDAVLRQPNLLINQLGDRFMNEGEMGNTTFTGNALALQPGNYAYCIMDEGVLKHYKKNGPDIFDIVHPADAFLSFSEQAAKAVEQGYEAYFEAETIEELAEKLGIAAEKLEETIEEYNEMCETGVDTKFHKKQEYLHLITGKGKYLVGKFYLGAYGTIGGVRINKYCEVLDEAFNPIEGLYSAGTDANTIYGDSYNFTLPGNSMGFAINSGRMASESAVEFIKEEER
ncbi:FAD-dependent oxidoreductase [Clostridium felsineum]|uniref:FAD-dependent oxidoreductase n=1 Tax=Clostridium felsineum TaxID=36839 RepID=UPI0009D40BDA|nr:Thiamine thiazole synthase [Clostridium felsineum DSM 794]